MAAAVILQRSKLIRAAPLLGSSLGRLLPGAAAVAICQLREIFAPQPVYSSIVPSQVRHYCVSLEEAYSKFKSPMPTNWGIHIVPEKKVFVVERLGRFSKMLGPGIHMLIPIVDRIAYIHSLKEEKIRISSPVVLTNDNVNILVVVDSIIHVKIVDPYLASYVDKNPIFSAICKGRDSVTVELENITLEKALSEIETLNEKIMKVVDEAATDWGVKCTRFEIMKISPSPRFKEALEAQTLAKFSESARVFESLGAMFDKEHLVKGGIHSARIIVELNAVVEILRKVRNLEAQSGNA